MPLNSYRLRGRQRDLDINQSFSKRYMREIGFRHLFVDTSRVISLEPRPMQPSRQTYPLQALALRPTVPLLSIVMSNNGL